MKQLSGQATVEWAVITGALLVVIGGLASLWRLAESGDIVSHALVSASYHIYASADAWKDVFAL